MEAPRPVLRRGRSALDYDLLPRDEFAMRLTSFRGLLRRFDLEAAVVAGTEEDYGGLAYLTGYAPPNRAAAVVVHQDHDPVVLVGMGRNIPYVTARTWVKDVRFYPTFGRGAATVLTKWDVLGGVGLVGVSTSLPVKASREVLGNLEKFRLRDLDDEFALLRRKKRPREMTMLRAASGVLRRGVEEARDRFVASSNPYAAALAAERACGLAGARDVRALVYDTGDGTWRRAASRATTAESTTLYLAVDRSGYWAESLTLLGRGNTEKVKGGNRGKAEAVGQAMRAMVEAVVIGSPLGRVADAALDELDGVDHAGARAIGFGSSLGLGIERAIRPGTDGPIEEGEVLSLQCFAGQGVHAAADSKTVVATGAGALPLDSGSRSTG